jgi:Predicted dehydrogenases and related proteins
MERIRMGVIGAGNIAYSHIKGIIASPDAELAAICDINEGVLDARADEYGVDSTCRFKNYMDMINSGAVDAVTICTPNNTHYEIARSVILKGLPFLLEKPVVIDYGQSAELERLARERNVPNMVGFSYRFKASARYARWLVREGYLGKILHLYGQYFQSWAISEKVELEWRFQKELSGSGTLGDLGSHAVDLARFMVGEFEKVCGSAGTFVTRRKKVDSDEYGKVDVDDYCHFLATLEGGIGAVFSVTRDAYGRGNYQRFEIYGTRGALVYKLDEDGKSEDVLEVCIGDVYSESGCFQRINIPDRFVSERMQSFFDIVNKKGDNLAATIEDGRVNQLILDSIIRSFESEKWIKIGEGIE